MPRRWPMAIKVTFSFLRIASATSTQPLPPSTARSSPSSFFFRSFSFVRSSSKSRRWPLCDFLFFLFCFVFCFFFGLGEFYSDASSFPLSVPRQVLYGEFVTEFYRVSIRPLPCWQWVDTAELFTRFHQFFVFNRATTHSIFRRLPTCSFFFGLELLAMTSPRFFFLPSCTEFFFSLPFD